ncbi:MAG: hypothetical protein Q7J27_12065 [Syntrophales bacterium]|nr:hypothetical protein [Syntrophales bacterium]
MIKDKKEVTFRYVYPNDLRDYYVNGAWGGATPRKEIYMHLYSERHPIPKTVTHEITDDGALGDQVKPAETGGDVVRLIQTSVIMDVDTAIRIRDWLDKFIKLTQAQTKEG